MKEIWILGASSPVGGADTELHHQVLLWRRYGIDVNFIPNNLSDVQPGIRTELEALGCKYYEYKPELLEGKIVASFCNGGALKRCLEINPARFIWFNCMTYAFDAEIPAFTANKITDIACQTEYQANRLLADWSKRLGKDVQFGVDGFPKRFPYIPYFDSSQLRPAGVKRDYFGIGRVSRSDPYKFSEDTWRIFDRVLTPIPKKVYILGYSNEVEKKIGLPPVGLDWMWWVAGAIPVKDLFSKIDVMIHKTGGSRENYCRVFIESMCYNTVPLAERDYGFPEMIAGCDPLEYLLCESSDEMSYKASELAFNPEKKRQLLQDCRNFVSEVIDNEERCIESWAKS